MSLLIFIAATMLTMARGETFTVDGLNYSVEDGVATVTGASSMNITAVTIPATVTYNSATYPVNFILQTAFYGCTSLRNVTVEDCDTYLGCHRYEGNELMPVNGSPFADCPVEEFYFGRNRAREIGANNDLLMLESTADAVTLTFAGKSTFISELSLDDDQSSPASAIRKAPRGFSVRISYPAVRVGGFVSRIASSTFIRTNGVSSLTLLSGNAVSISQSNFPSGFIIPSIIIAGGQYATMPPLNCAKISLAEGCTTIPDNFFKNMTSLTSVKIPSTVKEIGYRAFYNCTSLEEVNLPDSITTINNEAFYGCTKLPSPIFGSQIEKIGSYAYYDCQAITSITIPGSVTEIGSSAFRNCTGLTEMIFDTSDLPLTIGGSTSSLPFHELNLESLIMNRVLPNAGGANPKHVVFGEGWKTIPSSFLYKQNNLVDVSLPSTLEEIGSSAFYSCTSLERINFPDSLKTIGDKAFYDCIKLNSPIFGSQLETISSDAFYNCQYITDLIIPGSVNDIGSSAFNYCSALQNITFEKSERPLTFDIPPSGIGIFNDLEIDSLILNRVVPNIGKSKPKHIVFGEGWKSIASSIFFGTGSNDRLVSIQLPTTLEEICTQAFMNCTSLEEVNYPDSLKVIGSDAFYGCTKLPSPHFGSQLKTISSYAFYNCQSINELKITPNITTISESAFEKCSNLKKLTFEESELELNIREDLQSGGAFHDVEIDSLIINRIIPNIGSSNSLHVTFGECWRKIPDAFFYLEHSPISVTFPSTLEEIGSQAFESCKKLEQINFPDNLKKIGFAAFQNCEKLTSLMFGKDLEMIDYVAFSGCKAVKDVVFQQNIKEIGSSAFEQCESIKELTIPSSVMAISTGAFKQCTGLKKVTFEAAEQPLQLDYSSFDKLELDSLILYRVVSRSGNCLPKHITFGEGWEDIPSSFIYNNTSLESIILPSSLKNIARNAFYAVNLTSITCYAKVPPTCDSYSFSSEIYPAATVRVPLGTKRTYANADVWKNFSNIVTDGELLASIKYDSSLGTIYLNGKETDSISLDEGEPLDVSVVPNIGYYVKNIISNGVDCLDELTGGILHFDELTESLNIEIEFSRITHTVTVNTEWLGGTRDGHTVSEHVVEYGESIDLNCNADNEYKLASLTINDKITSSDEHGVISIETVTSDIVVNIVYKALYTITAEYNSQSGRVVINGSDGENIVPWGDDVSVRIIPAYGYQIARVIFDDSDVTSEAVKTGFITIKSIDASHTVKVEFEVKRVRLSISGIEGGQLTTIHDFGTEIIYLPEAYDGWKFHSATIGDDVITELEADGTITVGPLTEDTVISVVFKATSSFVDNIIGNNSICVTARNNTITIEGAAPDSPASVVDTNGISYYYGTDRTITLRKSGVYIVAIEGQSYKVLLR